MLSLGVAEVSASGAEGAGPSLISGERETGGERKRVEAVASPERHWAFTSPLKPRVPAPLSADEVPPRFPVDAFINAAAAREGLTPAPPAERGEWLRRVSFALTGLPPTLEEIDDFLADRSDSAFEKVVDRLLASPAYGERLAVDWLDAARYADTYGRHEDNTCATWPYRDWVIRMFNQNLPYDRFVAWQTAGDLMPEAGQDALIATAFNRLHQQSNEAGSNEDEFRWQHIFDRVATNARTFLGLTLECAQCHDHKHDPFTTRDYYQFAAYFNNIDELGLFSRFTGAVPAPSAFVYQPGQEEVHRALRRQVEEAEANWQAARRAAHPHFQVWLQSNLTPGTLKPVPTLWQRVLGRVDPRHENQATSPRHHFPLDETDKEARVVRDSLDPAKTGKTRNAFRPAKGRFAGGLHLRDDRDNQLMLDDVGHFRRIDPFSYSLWVQCPIEHDRAVILHHTRGGIDAAHRGYEFTLEDGRLAVTLAHFYPGNAIRVQAREKVSLSDWTHLGFTYDGSSRASGIVIYVNGRRIEADIVRDSLVKDITYRRQWGDYDEELPDLEIKTEATLEVGGRYLDRTLSGATIDELKVFSEELSAAEMAMLAGRAPPGDHHAWFDWYARTRDEAVKSSAAALQQARRAEDDFVADLTEVMVMREWDGPRRVTPILTRGQWDAPGETVEPGVPEVLASWPTGAPRNRLGLAQWLTDPRHPLVARVAANRYWRLVFGQGLVATPEDFGVQGARPTHPELLDWLAVWLVENGWDVKAYLRMLVLTDAYRRSSIPARPEDAAADPANVWLARGPRLRLSAEQVRDAALAASGLLVPTIGGPSVKPYQPEGLWEDSGTQHIYHQDSGPKLYRRSLYTFWRRTCPPPLMTVFDAPSREFCRVRRDETLTPLQGLALMNETGLLEAARVLAESLVRAHPDPREQDRRIEEACRRLIGRPPLPAQSVSWVRLVDEGRTYYSGVPGDAELLLSGAGEHPRDTALNPVEVAATLLMTRALLAADSFVSSP